MDSKTHYSTLGVLPTAEPEVIRASWKALAQLYHPDRNPRGAQIMMAINEAHDVLSDPLRRKAYDLLLDIGEFQPPPEAPPQPKNNPFDMTRWPENTFTLSKNFRAKLPLLSALTMTSVWAFRCLRYCVRVYRGYRNPLV